MHTEVNGRNQRKRGYNMDKITFVLHRDGEKKRTLTRNERF
jgi:hypothetical protein